MVRSTKSITYLFCLLRILLLLHCPRSGDESRYSANHQRSNHLSHRSSESLNQLTSVNHDEPSKEKDCSPQTQGKAELPSKPGHSLSTERHPRERCLLCASPRKPAGMRH